MKKLIGDKFMQLTKSDLLKGFILAVHSIFTTYIVQCLEPRYFPTNSKTLLLQAKIALGAGVAYVIKNFFSNSNGQFLKKDEATTSHTTDSTAN